MPEETGDLVALVLVCGKVLLQVGQHVLHFAQRLTILGTKDHLEFVARQLRALLLSPLEQRRQCCVIGQASAGRAERHPDRLATPRALDQQHRLVEMIADHVTKR